MNIKLLQWNIWYKEDIKNVVALLRQHQPDIICLQELTVDFAGSAVKDTPAYIAKQLGYNYYHKELPIESTDGTKMMFANGIFSRFPLADTYFAWINEPRSHGGYDDEYRSYVEVSLNIEGYLLHVGTTHMSYTHRFEPTPNKKRETDALLEQVKRHQTNFVLTGDLNAAPGSYTIDSLSKILQPAGPDFSQNTWTTKPFSYNGFEETQLNWRLDHVLTTSDVAVVSSKIISTDYSDHLPILVELKIA